MLIARLTADESAFDPETFPHRQFFGVYGGQYLNNQYSRSISDSEPRTLYGKVPLHRLENHHSSRTQHLPTPSDVDEVFLLLRKSGLSTELALDILERADYRWQRRSPLSDDPMHPKNREELLTYLKFCWILLIRCDVLVKACGKKIDWANDVSLCINDLFGVNNGALRRFEYGYWEDEPPDLIESWHSRITWLSG